MKKMSTIRLAQIILSVVMSAFLPLQAQIVIDVSDMPSTGDTVRISTATGISGIDPVPAGPAYSWDFSTLSWLSQSLDTFIAVTATPTLYQFVFNNAFIYPPAANLAQRVKLLEFIPGLPLQDIYQFYYRTNGSFSFLGYAGTISGIPIPIKYSPPDLYYTFPLNYGDADSSQSAFSFAFPGLGYIFSERERKNFVDGWGDLTTPYGTFQTLRVRSEVEEFDSVYIDSLGQGIALDRQFVEYRWLAKGFSAPLLQVTVEGPVVTATYIDSLRSGSGAGITEGTHSAGGGILVYPNPGKGPFSLVFTAGEPARGQLRVLDMQGRVVHHADEVEVSRGTNHFRLTDLSDLEKGCYFVEMIAGTKLWRGRLILADGF